MKTVTVEKYFPDDPGNKVYIVDAYVTVCKTYRVEAKNRDDAEEEVRRILTERVYNTPDDADLIRNLANEGFHDSEELEVNCSGECDGNGEEKFY